MSKFTFISNYVPDQLDRSNIASKLTVEFDSDSLDEVLGQFTTFLRGAGFYFDGDVEIVNNNIVDNTNITKNNIDNATYPWGMYVTPLSGENTFNEPDYQSLEIKGKFNK